MKASPFVFVLVLLLAFAAPAPAATWTITSPDKHQTFAFGDNERRNWFARNGHLVLHLSVTNDPYVDSTNPRQQDDFNFNFPDIRLATDGKTFVYAPPGHAPLPVARRRHGFLGIPTIELLPNAALQVNKSHGLLTLDLYVTDDRPGGGGDDNYYQQ